LKILRLRGIFLCLEFLRIEKQGEAMAKKFDGVLKAKILKSY